MKYPRRCFEEISQANFSLLTSEEILKISVRQITDPNTFDELGNAVDDGLYSPALGPVKKGDVCHTCGLGWLSCPGHFGHIDLPSVFYNPSTFRLTFRLLGASCVYCHRLRLTNVQSKLLGSKLLLLRSGKVVEAIDLDDHLIRSSSEPCELEKDDIEAQEDPVTELNINNGADEMNCDVAAGARRDAIAKIDEYVYGILNCTFPDYKCKASDAHASKNYHATYQLKEIEKNFLKGLSFACPHCGLYNPKYYEFKSLKIFQKPLSSKHYKLLAHKCIDVNDTLFGPSEDPNQSPQAGSISGKDISAANEGDHAKDVNFYLSPEKVLKRLQRVWSNDKDLISLLYGSYDSQTSRYVSQPKDLFLSVICVAPNKFRPASKLHDKAFEHPQSVVLGDILKEIHNVQRTCSYLSERIGSNDDESVSKRMLKELVDASVKLQHNINVMYDNTKADTSRYKRVKAPPGIRQILEKKEGLIRKHMMGKRVNYSARSVISPDPNVDSNEVGLPQIFAKRLTYVEPVTHFNVERLRKSVINGPNKWPGATHVQINQNTLLNLEILDEAGRKSVASQLLTHAEPGGDFVQQKVHRHILTGDFLLFNRQPTLHKPSIMCHTARVLPKEKTIRMNYINCNTYNADFDGDEMNLHFPQDEVSRSEAMFIARTGYQYLGPANGDVLRGLVQDHICAGVLICSRDVFFSYGEYVQLVYGSLRPERSSELDEGSYNIESATDSRKIGRIVTLPPAILVPVKRWTGKQVISTLLLNITFGLTPLNMSSKINIPAKQMTHDDDEDLVVNFLCGEMVTGCMDKSQLGAKTNGFMHSIYEVYGPDFCEKLLSAMGRLLTSYLQIVGFSCRLKDLRLNEKGETYRERVIDESKTVGFNIVKESLEKHGITGFSVNSQGEVDDESLKYLIDLRNNNERYQQLESELKFNANSCTSKAISKCIPANLLVPFPKNSMQVMTLSGAKGSSINSAQISVLLGQQELEGKRVPVMVSGKTLPSFSSYDTSIRAGGFISDRFFSGIRPQEYFFHCMAGREGLIDTAVKTSRSGYLQRCLIKHLEGIKVEYDNTVRNCDGSVIQFAYGEDSLDVTKSKNIYQFEFCARNYRSYLTRYNPIRLTKSNIDTSSVKSYIKKTKKNNISRDVLLHKFSPCRFLGAVSEKFYHELDNYIKCNPHNLLYNKSNASSEGRIYANNFDLLMKLKYQMSLVCPGEAVGLLAAQSIGEPSTQMTLNTFHLAGFGAKNITLGVPRLQEVIMMALKTSKTPIMRITLKDSSEKLALSVCDKFNRLSLSDVLEDLVVEETIKSYADLHNTYYCKHFLIKLKLIDPKLHVERHLLTVGDLNKFLKYRFLSFLSTSINREINMTLKRSSPSNLSIKSIKDDANNIDFGADSGGEENSHRELADNADKINELDTEMKDEKIDVVKEPKIDVEHSDSDSEEGSEVMEDAKVALRVSIKKEHESSTYDACIVNESPEESSGEARFDEYDNHNAKVEEDDEHFNYPRNIKSYEYPVYCNGTSTYCYIEVELPIETRILMLSTVEKACKKAVIREIEGVSKCFVTPNDSANQKITTVTTDGVNLTKVWELKDVVDCDSLYTNEINAVLSTYGIEAARAAIVDEVKRVFSAYGINVSYRHLSLIADYMTFEGGHKPLNRIGINSNPSPLAKMSFETTFSFLNESAITGDYDTLKTPSSCLIVGKPACVGTGSFDVAYSIGT